MAGDDKTQAVERRIHVPMDMLPECASSFATLTTQMAQITKSQESLINTQAKLIEKIKGNGVEGIEDRVSQNQRAITALTALIDTLIKAKEEDVRLLKAEKEAREKELKLTAGRLWQSDEDRKTELLRASEARKLETRKFFYGVLSAVIIIVASGAWGIYQTITTQRILLSIAGQ